MLTAPGNPRECRLGVPALLSYVQAKVEAKSREDKVYIAQALSLAPGSRHAGFETVFYHGSVIVPKRLIIPVVIIYSPCKPSRDVDDANVHLFPQANSFLLEVPIPALQWHSIL
jgi:hypothetical protein